MRDSSCRPLAGIGLTARYLEPPPSRRWFVTLEAENIFAGYSWATTKAAEDAEAARLSIRYADSLAPVLERRFSVQRKIEFFGPALVIARHAGDRPAIARNLGRIARAYVEQGQAEKALPLYEEQIEILESLGDRYGLSVALGDAGNAVQALGRVQKALECYRRQLEIAEELDASSLKAAAHKIWAPGTSP